MTSSTPTEYPDHLPFLANAFQDYADVTNGLTSEKLARTQAGLEAAQASLRIAQDTINAGTAAIADRDATITTLQTQVGTLQARVAALTAEMSNTDDGWAPMPDGYALSFLEKFDKPLDPTLWAVVDQQGYTRDVAWLDKRQVVVRDGMLIITADRLTTPVNGRSVVSGALSTRAVPGWWQHGGWFEACMALPTAAALWSAFWLRNGMKGELDILEAIGSLSPIVLTAHQNTDGKLPDGTKEDHLGYDWKPPVGWDRAAFHRYGLAWDADTGRVGWYIDGQLVIGRGPDSIAYPSGKPAAWLTSPDYVGPKTDMAMLLNLQVGGGMAKHYGQQVVDPAQLDGGPGAQLRVKWVRAGVRT